MKDIFFGLIFIASLLVIVQAAEPFFPYKYDVNISRQWIESHHHPDVKPWDRGLLFHRPHGSGMNGNPTIPDLPIYSNT
jgi:hypothetical protein